MRNGAAVPGVLDWKDVACLLGSTRVYLADPKTRAQARPFLVIGKFAQSSQPVQEFELTAILGLNFLTDNLQNLALRGDSGQLVGHFSS
jgi:hypothetical protein